MSLFSKIKKNDGWMAVSFPENGISIAFIKRGLSAMPAVEMSVFYAADKFSQAGTLERVGKELHLERYQCTTLLEPGEYQLLSVDAPNVPPDELKIAIRWRLKDMLDFHIDDATIDVLDVPVDKSAPGRNRSMYAVAARNQLIEQRQSLFFEAKIPLTVIDIPDLAQRNISALLEQDGRGIALLSFDAAGGLLTVTFAGELYLSRRIEVTFAQLLQSDVEQKNTCYERITLELQRSLDHFDRQYHFIAISKLVLAPLAAAGHGLKDYLAANLYIPVETLNLDAVLDISKVPELKAPEAQQRHFMALGAALRHEEKLL